jgi:uncharacterized membrane protein
MSPSRNNAERWPIRLATVRWKQTGARNAGEGVKMALGPVQIIAIGFPDNDFHGEIAPALAELVESNTIRVIDFIFVTKNGDGDLTQVEISELDDVDLSTVDPLIDDVSGLLSDEDLAQVGDTLEPNSSAMLMLFENVWATRFASAVRNAGGELILNEHIPHDVIEAAEAFAG